MIPIRNIWVLMLYACELTPELLRSNKNYDNEERDNIPNLVAEFLVTMIKKRLQRNLSFGYQEKNENLSRVRGRINLLKTERGRLLSKGQVSCHYEELTIDTKKNRFVLAALDRISDKIIIDRPRDTELKKTCKLICAGLKRMGVKLIEPSKSDISSIQISRNDREDRAMITAAKLVFNFNLPNQDDNGLFMYSPKRDDEWLRRIFENAVRGFYKFSIENHWKLNEKRRLKWPYTSYRGRDVDAIFPPTMEVDMILDNKAQNKRIVIDTKFNSLLTSNRQGEEKVRSGYIYQMYAYLRTQEDNSSMDRNAMGVLLHPVVEKPIDEIVSIQGHPIRVLTVNLTASTREMKRQLLEVTNFH